MILVEDKNKLVELQNKISRYDFINFDIETTGLDFLTDKILLIQLGFDDTCYILDVNKLGNRYTTYILQFLLDKTLVGHNIAFDLLFILRSYGTELYKVYDTMLAEQLINQGIGNSYYSYKELVSKYISIELDKSTVKNFISHTGEFTQEELIYAALDVKYQNIIREKQIKILEEQRQLKVMELEMSLIPVIVSMKNNGFKLNREAWRKLSEEALQKSEIIKNNITKIIIDKILTKVSTVPELLKFIPITYKTKNDLSIPLVDFLIKNLNISSPKQLLAILNNLFDIVVDNTNEKTIKKVKHDFITLILEYRENVKKATSFGDSILEKVSPITGRLHPDINQLRTATGRTSCDNPNLQQIPREGEYRKCFTAEPGWKLITVDFSQQELRLLAAISGEPKLVYAYKNNIDVHAMTASILYNKSIDQVTKEERQMGKTLNFATVYGTSKYGLNYNLNVDLDIAEDLLDKFWSGYTVLKEFMAEAHKFILQKEFSTTPLGRKRFFKKPILYSSNSEYNKIIGEIKREGFNQIIQGAGADVTKLSLIKIFYNNPFGKDLKVIMLIHDEIVCEVKEEYAEMAKQFIEKCMLEAEQKFLGDIPAAVDGKISDTWEH